MMYIYCKKNVRVRRQTVALPYICGGNTKATPSWYATLRQKLILDCVNDAQRKGEVITAKSPEFSRGMVSDMIAVLADQCSSEKVISASTMAFLVVFTFLSVGRGSEAATSSWDTARWSSRYGCALIVWPDLKTGTPEELPYFTEYEDMLLDF